MKKVKNGLFILLVLGLLIPILLQPTSAQAVPVTFDGVSQYTAVRNGAYAGFYNLTVDGSKVVGMCDDYLTDVTKSWNATINTYEDIKNGEGVWNDDHFTFNYNVYNIIGYLFIQTYETNDANTLADINAAIWKVTCSSLYLSGNALALYQEAIANGNDYTDWYGRMNIITPDIFRGSQEFLVQTAPVPEPATLLLLGTGLIGVAGFGKRRLKK